MIRKFWREIITDIAGNQADIGKVLSLLGVVSFLVFQAIALFRNGAWDPLAFGGGFSLILAGAGITTVAKDRADNIHTERMAGLEK